MNRLRFRDILALNRAIWEDNEYYRILSDLPRWETGWNAIKAMWTWFCRGYVDGQGCVFDRSESYD